MQQNFSFVFRSPDGNYSSQMILEGGIIIGVVSDRVVTQTSAGLGDGDPG